MRNSHKKNKFHIRKGDSVLVIAGNSKGKKGKVLEVYPKTYRAIVEGANFVTKHLKPSASNPNGSIEKQEAAIHLSNLKVLDPSSGEATRIGRKRNENGKLERYSKKTGEVIKNG
jgi:large subunit ribosomal protein L24